MNFTTDYENLGNGNELLPKGIYECIIKSAFLTATKNGTEYFSVDFIIRNDVPQKYKDRHIFHCIWKKKEPTQQDLTVEGFSFKQLMQIAKSVKLPSGKNYAGLDSLGEDFKSKCVSVTIEHSTYNGNTNEKVKYVNETKYPDCKHIFKNPVNSNTTTKQEKFVELENDDDLPF